MAQDATAGKHNSEPKWTACYECDRGGRGNAKDKCSCGWKVTTRNGLGCYIGEAIIGEPVTPPRITRSKQRYQNWLHAECGTDFGECFGECKKCREMREEVKADLAYWNALDGEQ